MDHNNGNWNLGRSSSAGGGIVADSDAAAAAAAAASGGSTGWRAQNSQSTTSEGSPSTRARGQSTWNKVKGAFKPSREEQAKVKPAAAATGNYD